MANRTEKERAAMLKYWANEICVCWKNRNLLTGQRRKEGRDWLRGSIRQYRKLSPL